MAEVYILKYTKDEGFTIQFSEKESETAFVRLEFDFEDNPTIEHIETLAEKLSTMDTHGKNGLYLDFNRIYLKNGGDHRETLELSDGNIVTRLNTESVQAVVKKLMSFVSESYTNIHVEDIDEENFAVLDTVLQNLPKHIRGLNLTYSQLDLLDQEQLYKALKESRLTKLSLAGALAEYNEKRIEQLIKNLPETLEEITVFENGIDDEEAELFASKVDKKTNIKWKKQSKYSSNGIPEIDFSRVGSGLWNEVKSQLNQAQTVTANYLGMKYQQYIGGTAPIVTEEKSAFNKMSQYGSSALDWITHTANPSLAGSLDELDRSHVQTKSHEEDEVIAPRKEDVVTAPRKEDVVIAPRKEDVVIAPREEDVVIAPREEDVVIAPREEDTQSTVSSSLLFGFLQAMKPVSIVLAAVVIGGLVGVGVGVAISAIATPGVGIAAGITVGLSITAFAVPSMYGFFSSSQKKDDQQEDEDLRNGCCALIVT